MNRYHNISMRDIKKISKAKEEAYAAALIIMPAQDREKLVKLLQSIQLDSAFDVRKLDKDEKRVLFDYLNKLKRMV